MIVGTITQDGEKGGFDCVHEPDIYLPEDDGIVCAFAGIARSEIKEVTKGRDFGGGSVRIGRFRLFGGKSKPDKETKLVELDTGSLLLTRKALIFLGGKGTVSIPVTKILQIEEFTDAIAITRSDRKTVQYFDWQDKDYSVQLFGVAGQEDGTIIPFDGPMLKQWIEAARIQ